MNENLTQKITAKLADHKRLFYVCRDIERAEGLLDSSHFAPYYFILTNKTPYSCQLQKKYGDKIILINNKKQLDTWEILTQIQTSKIITPSDYIVVFKNTKQIEKIVAENNWKLLNPSASTASASEEKISQIDWLGKIKKYLPGYDVEEIKNIKFVGQEFIIQFNYSHTGSGTILITSQKQLDELKKNFPNRLARIAKYIVGPLLTNNNVVWGNKTLLGNISYQITGMLPFTDKKFATIGNDWSLACKILNEKQITQYKKIVEDVGQNFVKCGWKGLFGIDVVLEEKTGKLYLLEINARQPASTSCESWLQMLDSSMPTYPVGKPQDDKNANVILSKAKNLDPSVPQDDRLRRDDNKIASCLAMTNNLTTFEAHSLALLEIPYQNEEIIKINNGAQIIQRVTEKIKKMPQDKIKKMNKKFRIVKYNNKKDSADLVRIQSTSGIMQTHENFNELGKEIVKIILG